MRSTFFALACLLACFQASAQPTGEYNVLVFSRTEGFRHNSIGPAIEALQALGREHSFNVVATEDAAMFATPFLIGIEAVVFLNTTLDVLDSLQQQAFQSYIRQGGGFVGIHAAADTEYDWPWYGELVGAYFDSHPAVQAADVLVTDRSHPATASLPLRWHHTDEWYNYSINPRANVHVVAVVDEKSYNGGTMGHDHPIAWAHEFEGGRAFYTGLGHTAESYGDPRMQRHLLGAIEWAAGRQNADVWATRAAAFDKVVLTGELTDPMEIDVASDGRVLIVEWAGAVKIWEPTTNAMRVIGWLPVEKDIEDGLLGLALDPNFDENHWLYIYYSPVSDGPKFNRLSRFVYDGEMMDMDSEIAVLEIPVQRVQCCHSGGSVQFDKDGLLYLSTGDNSGGPRDHEDLTRRRHADQGRTSANTNDLRGKILRIRPEPDGTYSIPEGNLFQADSLHRGEIWSMGHRNPFRISIDDSTGWVYWGDVGPGTPGGWDEFNQAQMPGYYGWPFYTGYNDVFPDYYAYGVEALAPDPSAPLNLSTFNTGAQQLPAAQPAWIRYSYGTSDEYPELGAGGLNPMAGPTFHYDAESAYSTALPSSYDNKVMIYEWMRNWVQVVTLDTDGSVLNIDPFLAGFDFIRPMDIEVGPHGRLYLVEWGDEFWGSNANAQLVRLDYHGGLSRPAIPMIARRAMQGAVEIAWPLDGGIFDFEARVPFEISISDQAIADETVVRTFTGFDTAPYPLDSFNGTRGSFVITHKYTHSPDVHYVDRFAAVEACLQGVCHRIRLQPRTKEAEHTSGGTNATRKTYSARPASEHWGRTALTVMQVHAASVLEYGPVNLRGIDSLTVRFRATAPGTIRLRRHRTTPLVQLAVGPEAGRPALPHQADYLASVPPDAAGLSLLEEGSYDRWREITVPVEDPGDTFTLVVDFESEAEETFLELDWIRFHGEGVLDLPSQF